MRIHALPSEHHVITKLKCLPNNQRPRQRNQKAFCGDKELASTHPIKGFMESQMKWLVRKSHRDLVSNHTKRLPWAIIPNGQKKPGRSRTGCQQKTGSSSRLQASSPEGKQHHPQPEEPHHSPTTFLHKLNHLVVAAYLSTPHTGGAPSTSASRHAPGLSMALGSTLRSPLPPRLAESPPLLRLTPTSGVLHPI